MSTAVAQRLSATDRDAFRAAVHRLPDGELKSVLTAVAYAIDDEAAPGRLDAPADAAHRWRRVLNAAGRAVGAW